MENTKKIYIEVGSNIGTDTDRFISDDSIVFCFEPSMELAFNLWNRFKSNDNVIVLPFAIDIESSFKRFNISGIANWGCSSLNDFNPNIHSEWPGRDFVFTDSYMVPTISLYDFIAIYQIPFIDYLWIDAQGHDFNVIKSLRDKIEIVKEGRCEASHAVSLYRDIDNSHTSIINYLNQYGFESEIELDKSGFGAECDVKFKKIK